MNPRVAAGLTGTCLIFTILVLITQVHRVEQERAAASSTVHAHEERRSAMCDRIDLMFGADDVAQPPPYTTDTRTRIQTDLAIFAPIAEGCVAIPPETNRALSALDNDQALQEGALALGRALTSAKTRGWPLLSEPGGTR